MTIQPTTESCPTCGSYETTFDEDYGFWKCSDCQDVWGRPEDDPDYEEIEDFIDMEYQENSQN